MLSSGDSPCQLARIVLQDFWSSASISCSSRVCAPPAKKHHVAWPTLPICKEPLAPPFASATEKEKGTEEVQEDGKSQSGRLIVSK